MFSENFEDLDTEDSIVLCGSNSYQQKYYYNPEFNMIPDSIKDELKIMCVRYTEEAGGIITMEFDKNGSLKFKVRVADGDYMFDEIESGLKISKYQKEKEELVGEIELFYKVVFLGEEVV